MTPSRYLSDHVLWCSFLSRAASSSLVDSPAAAPTAAAGSALSSSRVEAVGSSPVAARGPSRHRLLPRPVHLSRRMDVDARVRRPDRSMSTREPRPTRDGGPGRPAATVARIGNDPSGSSTDERLSYLYLTRTHHQDAPRRSAPHLTKAIATSSRALASETSLCTSCRFDTSSPAPRWCATRSIRVIPLHRRPHAHPPCHLGTPPADHKHVRSPQAAGAYYAPAAYKVYEAESAVTAAEYALHALNARIKSVRDAHPTPSALGQISILPPVPRCAQYPSR